MRVMVVAPHPDDEVLGPGGTLLRRKAEGCELAWLIVTSMSEGPAWTSAQIRRRDAEIKQVAETMGFDEVFQLGFEAASLDVVPIGRLAQAVGDAFLAFRPNELYLPHRSDAHTDHRIAFDAAAAGTKWFRYPFVERVLAYETLSETDASLQPGTAFRPQCFSNIEGFLDQKVALMSIYESEVAPFPFPRSAEAIRALASVRGAACGFAAAEAFELLRERR